MTDVSALRQTPLRAEHERLGARMVEFGGWYMPVQYASIIEEHRAVRQAAGLFDLCHMGEVYVSGAGALDLIQRLSTNDAERLAEWQAQYSLLCREDGGVLDDIIVYRLPDRYLVVVNASNQDRDAAWFQQHAGDAARVDNRSAAIGMVALQGPEAARCLQALTETPLDDLRNYWCREGTVAGVSCLIARTGYTGEDGFELYCAVEQTPQLWRTLLEGAAGVRPVPCGLGARDTLRLEAGMPLYGHELTETTNPYEAGLGRVVRLNKAQEFVGRAALARIKADGPRRRLVGLEMTERGIPRADYPVVLAGREVGVVTSGTYSPTLDRNIAMAYVPVDLGEPGTEVGVVIRGRPVAARVRPLPFYKRPKPATGE